MRLMSFLLVFFFSFSSLGFVNDKHFSNRKNAVNDKTLPTVNSGIILKTKQVEEIRIPARVNQIPARPYPDGVAGEWKLLRKAERK